MFDTDNLVLPSVLQGITTTTESLELTMADEMRLGSLLRTLVASRADAPVLQLGAGSGVLTAWLLDGMHPGGKLDAIEPDAGLAEVAGRFLGRDGRLAIHSTAPVDFLEDTPRAYGLIAVNQAELVAPVLGQVLSKLADGGMAVFGGLVVQEDWTADQRSAAEEVGSRLQLRSELHVTALDWASGVMIAARRHVRGSE